MEVLISKIDEIPLVDEVELLAHERSTSHKAIVDLTTMNTLCIVPKKNKIIQHRDVLKEIMKLDNYTIKSIHLLKNGLILSVEVTERTPRKIELLPDDYLECGARIINDYSKNRGLSVQAIATRLVCSNGMIAPKLGRKMKVYAYGTSEFSNELEEQINTALDAWTTASSDIFLKASQTKVHVKGIISYHSFLSKKYMEQIISELNDVETLYNIYNKYTEIITHKVKANNSRLIKLQKRANRILTMEIPAEVRA